MQIFASLDADLKPYALTGGDVTLYWKQEEDGSYAALEHTAALYVVAGWDAAALTLNRVQAVTIADPPAGQVLASYVLAADAKNVISGTPTYVPAPPASVPPSISRMQAELELHATASPTNAGKTLLDDVNAAIAAAADPTIGIYWNTVTAFERQHPKLLAMAQAMGWSSAYVDQLFVSAAQQS